jgi:pimeloyl-ACP methyl ester carboxylesterase
VKCPVLALIGSKDLQVSPRENLTAIASALKSGGINDYKVVEIPNLNHLFQTSSTGLPGEYGTIEETMSPEVLELISKWIIQHQ